jgi:hypothetical protein
MSILAPILRQGPQTLGLCFRFCLRGFLLFELLRSTFQMDRYCRLENHPRGSI